MREKSEYVYELGSKTITITKSTTGSVEIKYEDDNGNLAYFTPSEARSFIGMLDSVMKRQKIDVIDTCTEYGYINIEKNGKKGGIIL